MKTIDVRTAVAGRGNVHQLRRLAADFRFKACAQRVFANHRSDVFADSFTKAGSGNADHAGLVLCGYVLQTAPTFSPPPKMALDSLEARRGDVHRFPEMADDVPAHVGRASLRAVQERHCSFNSAKYQACAQRRAQLARIPCRDIAGLRGRLLKDVQTRVHIRNGAHTYIGAHTASSFRLRDVNCHTGLITVECTSRAKLTMPANPAKASLRS